MPWRSLLHTHPSILVSRIAGDSAGRIVVATGRPSVSRSGASRDARRRKPDVALTQDRLKEVLAYDPRTGVWTRRQSRFHQLVGKSATHLKKDGYLYIFVDGWIYPAHRLAFLYIDGRLPAEVDHINRNKADCRWANLRPACGSQNNYNKSLSRNNTSGFKGVTLKRSTGKWVASIRDNGRRIHLGTFEDPENAYKAYNAAYERAAGPFVMVTP